MFTFDIQTTDKAELYRELLGAIDAVTAGEADGIANMANAASLFCQYPLKRQRLQGGR